MTMKRQDQVITSTNVDLSSKLLCGIHSRTVSQEIVMNLIHNMCLGIIFLKSLPHCPGANELKFYRGWIVNFPFD